LRRKPFKRRAYYCVSILENSKNPVTPAYAGMTKFFRFREVPHRFI
jgi:hypothetical protein